MFTDAADFLSLLIPSGQSIAPLIACNEYSSAYGLTLTPDGALRLSEARKTALRQSGRVEFGDGILPKLIYAFCDSPYIEQSDYESTLAGLQELFYQFKNETKDRLSDDDLISAMETVFNGRGGGSLDYLAGVTPEVLMNGGHAESAEDEEDGE